MLTYSPYFSRTRTSSRSTAEIIGGGPSGGLAPPPPPPPPSSAGAASAHRRRRRCRRVGSRRARGLFLGWCSLLRGEEQRNWNWKCALLTHPPVPGTTTRTHPPVPGTTRTARRAMRSKRVRSSDSLAIGMLARLLGRARWVVLREGAVVVHSGADEVGFLSLCLYMENTV